jgi:metal-responsive CopG/Arc/MetJ family transcriptional regulator
MGKLIVELPDKIHRELKRKATTDSKTLKEVITNLIKKYLSGVQEQSKKKEKTGLCGMWEDERSAEEVIRDIKTHRKWFDRNARRN